MFFRKNAKLHSSDTPQAPSGQKSDSVELDFVDRSPESIAQSAAVKQDPLMTPDLQEEFQQFFDDLPDVDQLNDLYPSTEAFDKRIHRSLRFFFVRKKAQRIVFMVARVIAITIGLLLVASTILLSVDATREAILDTIKNRNSYEVLDLSGSQESIASGFKEPTWLPEGFVEVEREESLISLTIQYKNSNGILLSLRESVLSDNTIFTDSYHQKKEPIVLTEGSGFYFVTTEMKKHYISWSDDSYHYLLMSSFEMTINDLIGIANSFS